jgi:predicted DNA-binding transcriptional regulator AlpA
MAPKNAASQVLKVQPLEVLLNEYELAEITGQSVATARRNRLTGRGPTFLKLGANVRYRPSAVAAWLNARPTGGNREAA